MKQWTLGVLLLAAGPAAAGGCQAFSVSATDGYANVRMTPGVTAQNSVAALPSGTSITVVRTDGDGWLQIESPVQGWIARTQTASRPCESAAGVSATKGLAAIARLAKEAIAGDRGSAATFLRMSRGLDGSFADAYGEAITHWAARNPTSLVARLEREPPAVRAAALESLAFGWGTGSRKERRQFEAALARRPPARPLAREWRRLAQDAPSP